MNSKQRPVVIYTPESAAGHPLKLLREIWNDMLKGRELAWRITVRDISAQYRQSLLGIVWAFVPPVLTAILFMVLQKKQIVNFGDTGMPYPVFAVIGTMLWQTFTESLTTPLRVTGGARPMLAKINFPREALILSSIYQVLFGFAIKLALLIVLIPLLGGEYSLLAPLFLIPVFIMILIGITIGFLLTPFGLLYGDISSSLPVVTQFLFFLTPVVYPAPQQLPYSLLAYINPASPFLTAAREILINGSVDNFGHMFVVGGLTIIATVGMLILYRLSMPIIIERISS